VKHQALGNEGVYLQLLPFNCQQLNPAPNATASSAHKPNDSIHIGAIQNYTTSFYQKNFKYPMIRQHMHF